MKRKLLLRAAEVLAAIPPERFNLAEWVTGDARTKILDDQKVTKKDHCGTVACAAGWLGLTPEFQKLGLKFEAIPGTYGKSYDTDLTYVNNEGKSLSRFDGLAQLFDVDYYTALELFCPAGTGNYDREICDKHGWELSDRDLFQHRVKKIINLAKKGKKQ